MRNFFIDFENVHSTGMDSLEQLAEGDRIFVFYSNHAETITIPVVKQICKSPACVEFIQAETGKPNALDFQLVAGLFMYATKDDDNYIISKDTGYDTAIRMGIDNGFRIKRYPSISGAFSDTASDIEEGESDAGKVQQDGIIEHLMRFKMDSQAASEPESLPESCDIQIRNIVAEICGEQVNQQYGDLVVSGVKKCTNRMQFYQFFNANLGMWVGGDLYRGIRNRFEDMRHIIEGCGLSNV